MGKKASVVALLGVIALPLVLGIPPRGRAFQSSSMLVTATAPLRLAPDIEIIMYQGLTEVGGEKIALSDLWVKKRRPVVLNFWAGLCPPCRAEMPDFQRLFEQPNRKFVLIGVDIGPFIGLGSRNDGKALLRALRITYPAGTTFDAQTVRNYEILGMPTTLFITADGHIRRRHIGLLTFEQMKIFSDEVARTSTPP